MPGIAWIFPHSPRLQREMDEGWVWREAEIWLPHSLPALLIHCGVRGWWKREEVHRHKEPNWAVSSPITVVCKQMLDRPATEDARGFCPA